MQGVSLVAARRGALEAGVKDNEILIFSELMDAKSLFLTANVDTRVLRWLHRCLQRPHGI
jgi:hypothetical protein